MRGPFDTWEVDGGLDGCAGCHGGVDQVRILEPEPGGEGARVRAAERHPLPAGQPAALRRHGEEVSEVGQRLATAQETQAAQAEVTEEERREERVEERMEDRRRRGGWRREEMEEMRRSRRRLQFECGAATWW